MSEFHCGAKTWTLRRVRDQPGGSAGGTDERRENWFEIFDLFFSRYKNHIKANFLWKKYKNKSNSIFLKKLIFKTFIKIKIYSVYCIIYI